MVSRSTRPREQSDDAGVLADARYKKLLYVVPAPLRDFARL